MKPAQARKSLLLIFMAIILIGLGFDLGRWTAVNKIERQAGFLVIDPHQKLKVAVWYVIDGDTLRTVGGERVRLMGIDAPGVNDPEGQEALSRLKNLTEDKIVKLEFDSQTNPTLRDLYGRLLAYVWLDDTLVNEELIKQGLAKTTSKGYSQKTKYQARFLEAQKQAQEEKLGLWR